MLQRKILAIQLSQNPNPADDCAKQQYPFVGGPLKIEKQIAKILFEWNVVMSVWSVCGSDK